MKKFVYLCFLSFIGFLTACTKPVEVTTDFVKDIRTFDVSVYTTKGDRSELLDEGPGLVFEQVDPKSPLPYTTMHLLLDDTITYQEIDGFGAAMSESSAYLINQLSKDARDAVIKDLFSSDGIRMNFVRIPMGASDFALSSYTYNDMPSGETDKTLEHFTLERDEAHVIPVLKEAFKWNNEIKLMGSPWSAPAWMKTSGHLNHGSLKPEYYEVYSYYFVKFIETYQSHELPIYAVTLQNEPLHESWSYPSMKMSSTEQRDFIRTIGPVFKEKQLDTKIIAYDHNWDQRHYPYPIYQDSAANDYVAGAAFHCYAGDVAAQSIVQQAFPDKGIWFTECSGGGWATDFASNLLWNMENLFIGSVNHYSKSVLLWNIALDENFGPKNNGCSNCRGVLEISSDGQVSKNEEYYSIGHFSKFIDTGARRIDSKLIGNDNILTTAVKNPNGDIVVVMANKASNQARITIEYDGLHTQYVIPGRSVSTLIIE